MVNVMKISELSAGDGLSKRSQARLGFGGDLLIRNSLSSLVEEQGAQALFAHIHDFLGGFDLNFANLESPVTTSDSRNPKKEPSLPFMKLSPVVVESLSHAPFHVLQIANNHIMDYGPRGLADTVDSLDHAGIAHVGAGSNLDEARSVVIKEINGVKVGYLAYSNTYYADKEQAGCAPLRQDVVIEDIKRYRDQCDFLAVGIHQGIVYCDYPLPEHMEMARSFIDAGANLIVGHHPHVIQGMEFYNGGLIAYSLNSLILDWTKEEELEELEHCTLAKEGINIFSPEDRRPRQGIYLAIDIEQTEAVVEFVPVVQEFGKGPAVAMGDEAQEILARFRTISEGLHNKNLEIWAGLEKLNSLENVAGIYEYGLIGNLKKIHRIRPRHFKYLKNFIFSKIGL